MNSFITDSESTLRLTVFLSVFLLLALLELIIPRRKLTMPKARRWTVNIGISFFNTALIRLVVPLAGVAAAEFAQQRNWGVFNLLDLPPLLGILIFLLLFDLAIYFQHRLFHLVPLFWRLHRMHHTDMDYDVTTGNRFHPASILLSSLIKLGLVLVMGPLSVAIVLAEILLNATSMFNHSNISVPVAADRVLRMVIVTPDMHRIHHSVDEFEHNKNFGFNFPWWDRLFGTYLEQPRLSQEQMEIGIRGFQDRESAGFLSLLMQPLK
jgi:sterol desaturase/sphingolipid hydroxylase (fatty acid hydroxylase superfamily)